MQYDFQGHNLQSSSHAIRVRNPGRISWARYVKLVEKYERQEQSFGPNSDKMISLVRKKCKCEDNIKWVIKQWWRVYCLLSPGWVQGPAMGCWWILVKNISVSVERCGVSAWATTKFSKGILRHGIIYECLTFTFKFVRVCVAFICGCSEASGSLFLWNNSG